MRKITDKKIYDFSKCENGFVFTAVEPAINGSNKISLYSYNALTNSVEHMNTSDFKKNYIKLKFGEHAEEIADQLGNNSEFIFNDCTRFDNNEVIALNDEGNLSLFDSEGKLKVNKRLLYHDQYPTLSPASYKNSLWCAVPSANCIVNYSYKDNKIHLIAIGYQTDIFNCPRTVTVVGNNLYVCNKDSGKIKFLQLDNAYHIGTFKAFKEPVYKYIRSCGKDFVLLKSGIYEVDPNEFNV